MTDMINGRTPEEIKRWVDGRATCNTCPKGHEVGCEYGERTKDCQMSIDTIAYIERLESERDAALSKVPKWISVEDRLPDHNQRVLAYRAESRDTFEEFRMCCGWAIKGKITHWMPLPEPPKEDE